MDMAERIRDRLQAAFRPDRLDVVNESHRHAGHAGDDGSGESHFAVMIRAGALAPQSRVARHRAIHAALGPEIVGQIHALAIDAG
ncbi:BolA family protein [Szabonella alba]|uniref:BolA family transcriptional regulator n=1 Tax=Szabonella alba TaxID=2804194 RepID=A0A8K0V857_9RHOB|nr:BolA family protein [Szabonella alba]MBL4917484.1 BolA family transcriptional regulator [Szabonella alba]